MDDKRSRAVTEEFNRLYKEGLIYRYYCQGETLIVNKKT